MSFESLRHTPEFELPSNAPSAPGDLISLIEECHEGLSKVLVSKMIRRGKYEQISVIICQDNPGKKTVPVASADDIADYCMMCMQYEMDKSDDPGNYKVEVVGPPGKGSFRKSKHIDLTDGDGMARSKTMVSEGDLMEQQLQYIQELHSQIITMSETVHGLVGPLVKENREMMKIVSESTRRLAEVERDRMKHDLEMRIHNDDVKLEELKEEEKGRRWSEGMEMIKDSGAVEGLLKALMKKLKDADKKKDDTKDEPKEETKKKEEESPKDSEKKKAERKKKKKKGDKGSKVDKAKKKKKGDSKSKRKPKISEETGEALSSDEDLTPEQMAEVFTASAMERMADNPTAVAVEVLRMSIEENGQWDMVKETLSEEQFVLFKEILDLESDEEIEPKLKDLYALKGARRMMKLEAKLDDDQQKVIEQLLVVAAD